MKRLIHILLFLSTLACFVTSCSIEKRVYRKGYHVAWNKNRNLSKKVEDEKNDGLVTTTRFNEHRSDIGEVVAALGSNNDLYIATKNKFTLPKDTCGDILLLQKGDRLLVKVLEIDKNQIKYKRCDNLDGPLFVIHKRSVAMLQYTNGIKENLDVEDEVRVVQNTPYQTPYKNMETNGLGIASFVCAVGGFVVGFPFLLAMPLAIASLKQFKREPDRYKDKWMPRTALIISAIIYLLGALLILLLYSVFSAPFFLVLAAIFGALGLTSILSLNYYS